MKPAYFEYNMTMNHRERRHRGIAQSRRFQAVFDIVLATDQSLVDGSLVT
jgi:hypothetical protein